MADDALPTESASPAPAPAAGSTASPPAPAASPTLTNEDVAAIRSIPALVQGLRGLSSRVEALAPTAPAASPSDAEDSSTEEIQEFAKSPRSWVVDVIKENTMDVVREQMGPPLARHLSQQRDAHLTQFASEIDHDFGAGFFESEIKPKLLTGDKDNPGALERLNPWAQADRQIIEATIQGAMGQLYMQNRQKLVEAQAKATRERQTNEAPSSWGGGSRGAVDREGRVNPEIREGLSRMNEEMGQSVLTEEDFKRYTALGAARKTLDGWLTLTKKN